MPTLTLTQADDGKASYALDLRQDVVRLVNPQGNVIAMFERSQAPSNILLPSKIPPRTSIALRIEPNQIIHLTPDPRAVDALRAYLGTAPDAAAASGQTSTPTLPPRPHARSVTRDIAIGVVILLVGLGMTLIGFLELARGALGWGLLILGLLVALVGAGWLYEARTRRARSLRDDQQCARPPDDFDRNL